MEEKTAAGRERNLSPVRRQPPGFAEAGRKDRTGGLRIADLYSQVWCDSSRRGYGSQALAHLEDVPRTDVFLRPRRSRWWNDKRWVRASGIILLPLSLASLAGCHSANWASLGKSC